MNERILINDLNVKRGSIGNCSLLTLQPAKNNSTEIKKMYRIGLIKSKLSDLLHFRTKNFQVSEHRFYFFGNGR